MLLQPGIEILVAIDLPLQLLQCMQSGFGLGQLALLLLQCIALLVPLRVRQRQLLLQVRQFFNLLRTLFFQRGYLLLRLLQRAAIGSRQIVFFQQQSRAARFQLLNIALQIGMLRIRQLQLLLQLQLFTLQFVVAILRGTRCLFRLRQVLPL